MRYAWKENIERTVISNGGFIVDNKQEFYQYLAEKGKKQDYHWLWLPLMQK